MGRIPAGTTQEFLDTAETQPGGGDHDQVGRSGEAAAMKTIKVSDATHRAIAETAILPLSASGKQQPDGTWLVPIEDDTWEALESQRRPGESDDDTIQRLIRHHREQPLNRTGHRNDAAGRGSRRRSFVRPAAESPAPCKE